MGSVVEKAESEADAGTERRKWAETLFYVIISGWFIILLYEARGWGHQDRLLPTLVLVPGIVLLTFQLLKMHVSKIQFLLPDETKFGVSTDEVNDRRNENENSDNIFDLNSYVYILIWVLSLPALLYIFGFFNTVPIYIFCFVYFYKRDIKDSIITSSFTLVFVYVLFEYILDTRIWNGAIF